MAQCVHMCVCVHVRVCVCASMSIKASHRVTHTKGTVHAASDCVRCVGERERCERGDVRVCPKSAHGVSQRLLFHVLVTLFCSYIKLIVVNVKFYFNLDG